VAEDEEERLMKKEEDYAQSSLQGCWSSFFGRLSPPICLVYVYVVFCLDFYTFDIEICSCLEFEYIESVMCNLLMYSTLI
jgi:hypothetical protein